jgi:hypothetical protein
MALLFRQEYCAEKAIVTDFHRWFWRTLCDIRVFDAT